MKWASLISPRGKTGDLTLPPAVDLFAKFVGAMRGLEEPLVSAEDSLSIARVCLKAREAADKETWIKL